MVAKTCTYYSAMAPAANSTRRSRKIILTLTGLWLLLYESFTLFRPPLLDDADSVHAEVAREMVARHDWITLYANGIRYLEKAPLMYWGMATSFTVFGPEDWAARIPLAIAALAQTATLQLPVDDAVRIPEFYRLESQIQDKICPNWSD